ncbi:MAG TPA: ribonuclease R [candidate division Zixibacteria bacterium]|nr:ribonuclease R [candidate division Zixibacteria bacterium]
MPALPGSQDRPSARNSATEKILALFARNPRLRLTPAEIQRRGGFAPKDLQAVVDALRALCREGRLVRLKKNHYALPDRRHLVVGRVHAHPDGYGFLIPEDKSIADLYLSRREMRRLMHGDRVVARADRRERAGFEARVIQILERGQKRVVGTYREIDGRPFVIPMDARIAPMISLRPSALRPPEGKVIAAEIARYGTAFSAPEAVLVEIVGDADDPETHVRSIVYRYGLSPAFSEAARREAAACRFEIPAPEIAARADLRSLAFVTIDGENARDFDDAVHVRKKDGRYELFVSIADVAFYVRPQSALDEEAYARGTSVYFPDRALPMLPEVLSNGICSLNPGEDRLTKTVALEIGARGEITRSRFLSSVIRSRARMTYTEVARILGDGDAEATARCRDLVGQFRLMEELALLLCERRRARGSLDFDLPEAEIVLDLQGVPENIVRAERNIAHRIIEEFMISANEAVARHLTEHHFPLLYRVHEGPDPQAVEAIAPFLASLGYRLPVKREKLAPTEVQRVLEACRGKPEEKVVNHVLLRAMKQAHYQPENIGHFGLASTCYTHFTSPIRRYPDLIVHRMLERLLQGTRLRPSERDELLRYLDEAGRHTSERERNAMDAEREMIDLKKAQFMMDKLGEEFAGFITRLAGFGFFVELEDYFVEGLVRLSTLTDDDYHYYEKEYVIKGRRHGRKFRLGDRVRIKVTRITAFRGEIDFELVSGPPL